ncbi:hypothetical protein [Pseudomonas citronellolis]|uniref:hypothetical protein n=1 Tax=Pseudomonas citronellolis TaxID=53408 RepID=UPI003204F105
MLQSSRKQSLFGVTELAPRVCEVDIVGSMQSFELHHLERITDGDGVYDVDNLRVNTPRNHIDLHRKET